MGVGELQELSLGADNVDDVPELSGVMREGELLGPELAPRGFDLEQEQPTPTGQDLEIRLTD